MSQKRKVLASIYRAKKLASLSKQARTLVALAKAFPRLKLALFMDESQINRAVEQQLKKEGFSDGEIPDVDWGSHFTGIIQNVKRKYQWEDNTAEELGMNVFEDMLMEFNQETGNSIKGIPTYVKEFQKGGKSGQDILSLIGNQFADKLEQKWKHHVSKGKTGPSNTDQYQPYEPIEKKHPQQREESGQAEKTFESLLQVDPGGKGMAGNWMNLVEDHPELREIIKKTDRKMKSEDKALQLMWEAYKKDAADPQGSWSIKSLANTPITYRSPDGGREKKLLEQALDDVGASANMNYMTKKLRKTLQSMWPNIDEWVQETMR